MQDDMPQAFHIWLGHMTASSQQNVKNSQNGSFFFVKANKVSLDESGIFLNFFRGRSGRIVSSLKLSETTWRVPGQLGLHNETLFQNKKWQRRALCAIGQSHCFPVFITKKSISFWTWSNEQEASLATRIFEWKCGAEWVPPWFNSSQYSHNLPWIYTK